MKKKEKRHVKSYFDIKFYLSPPVFCLYIYVDTRRYNCNHFPVSLIYATPNVHLFPHLVDANHPSEVKLLPLALSKALKALVSLYSGQTQILRTKAQCENGLLNSLTHTHPETRGPGKLWSSVKPPEERCGVGLISSFEVLAQKFQ